MQEKDNDTLKNSAKSLGKQTVSDFGDQWNYFTKNDGYYASDEFFDDLIKPLLKRSDFDGANCAEIGAGTGNIAAMIMRTGASHLVALEPSSAIGPLRKNIASFGDRVEVVEATGECLPDKNYDLVLSIGVLHHIPDPAPVVLAAHTAIKPGGKFFVWLYGKEGNAAYLAFAQPIRIITKKLPMPVLHGFSYVLDGLLQPLTMAARAGLKVPLANYLTEVYGKMAAKDRRLVIVDQLNPAWAKYYTEEEARALLENAGFEDVNLCHRHGYSWSVIGTKPSDSSKQ